MFNQYIMLCGLFIILSCGKTSDNENKEEGVFKDLGYSGRWQSACFKGEEGDSSQQELSFYGSVWQKSFHRFDKDDCSEDSKNITFTYRFTGAKQLNKSRIEGGNTVEYLVDTFDATPYKEWRVQRYKKSKAYGTDDWTVGKSTNINGKKYDEKSEAYSEQGESRLHTFKTDGDKLFVANYKDDGTAFFIDNEESVYFRK